MWRNIGMVVGFAVIHFVLYMTLWGTEFAIGDLDSSHTIPMLLAVPVMVLGTPLMFLLRLPPPAFGNDWWGDDMNFILLLAFANALLWGAGLVALSSHATTQSSQGVAKSSSNDTENARSKSSGRFIVGSHPISRILCLCGHLSGTPVSRRLKRRIGARSPASCPGEDAGVQTAPSGLAPDGVYPKSASPPTRCALTLSPEGPHHFALTGHFAASGGMFLWHFPAGRPARPLAGIAALWSPDFPLTRAWQRAQRPPG